MADLCNRLEKLVPPPFVTVKAGKSKDNSWIKFQKKLNYPRSTGLLSSEIDFLNGYIVRKGTQLRLEKALLLTTQVLKLCQRWKSNDLLQHIVQFQEGVGRKNGKQLRRPSRQWATWLLYLMLREAALLAKVKLECENTTKFWLGMIASGHHWGDSLVITGILSRIWHLSSIIVEEVMDLYPLLLKYRTQLEPTNSPDWPDDNWEAPEQVYHWLRKTMKLSFERARLNLNLSYLSRKSQATANGAFSILARTFEPSVKLEPQNVGGCDINFILKSELEIHELEEPEPQKAEFPQIDKSKSRLDDSEIFFFDTTASSNPNFMSFSEEVEGEDVGVVVQNVKPERKKKRRKPGNVKLLKEVRHDPTNWKAFEKYWSALTEKCSDSNSTRSPKERKILLGQIKAYANKEVNGCPKIRTKLDELALIVQNNIKDKAITKTSRLRKKLNKFDEYIRRRTQKLKTA